MQATSGILLGDLIQPTSIQGTFAANHAEIPAAVVYGSATSGQLEEYTLPVVADNATRCSKGLQGVLMVWSDQVSFSA